MSKNKKNIIGRKRKEGIYQIFDDSIHTKLEEDHLLLKIQTNYLTFIVDFSNELLKFIGFEGKFYQIKHTTIKKESTKNILIFKKFKYWSDSAPGRSKIFK